MKIVFRTDSSVKMGSGHLIRCLALAEEIKSNGWEITFISRAHSGNLNSLISKKGLKVVELPKSRFEKSAKRTSWADNYEEWLGLSQGQDAKDTIKAIEAEPPEWLIVDHYSLDEKWEKSIRAYVKNIMVIDDLANRYHDCDILLDQNWFENMNRYDGLVSSNCTQLLGPKYALLRPEFAKARKKLKPHNGDVKRIFVFFGGSDPHNLTSMALRALSEPELAHLKIDIVIGENNIHRDEIQKLTEYRKLTHLHVQVDSMAAIMVKADLAIGAGGVNTWERMCIGLPALVISIAENQDVLLDDLVKNCYTNFLGNITNVDKFDIKKGILDIIGDRSLIKDQSIKTYKLLDGSGSRKVTDWLIGDLSNLQFKVTNTTEKDMELYWIWANDKQVRNNALNKERITWEQHVKWFQRKLENKNCSLYLILADKKPIGQVRFEKERDYARISYSIASQFRGKKLGKKILRLAIHEYQKNNIIKMCGEVLPNNIASEKTFESLGFTMEINRGNKIYTKESKNLVKINA
jgi:UDP-2,4-diacetamido-2,4,6-trideoxy-beta-L-altropyranose hydrolase